MTSVATVQPRKDGGIRILEGLAATGLRAIRYALELPGVSQIVANDFDAGAVASMKQNVEFNGAQAAEKITPSHADARLVMLAHAGVRCNMLWSL